MSLSPDSQTAISSRAPVTSKPCPITNKLIKAICAGLAKPCNNKLIFIRHALAPGNGDPDNFDIFDCSTQRNLNSVGREQSIELGNFFDTNNISIDLVLSSEWCRCKETANLAFKKFETFNALNSFFSSKFEKNKDFLSFKSECSKMGTTEEALANAEQARADAEGDHST
mgnify:CR=1 FL=1